MFGQLFQGSKFCMLVEGEQFQRIKRLLNADNRKTLHGVLLFLIILTSL